MSSTLRLPWFRRIVSECLKNAKIRWSGIKNNNLDLENKSASSDAKLTGDQKTNTSQAVRNRPCTSASSKSGVFLQKTVGNQCEVHRVMPVSTTRFTQGRHIFAHNKNPNPFSIQSLYFINKRSDPVRAGVDEHSESCRIQSHGRRASSMYQHSQGGLINEMPGLFGVANTTPVYFTLSLCSNLACRRGIRA